MTDTGLPAGWRLELSPGTRRTDGGRTLVGGTPLRVVRLSVDGARWLDRSLSGELVSESRAHRTLARRLTDADLLDARPPEQSPPRQTDVVVVIPVRDDPDGLRHTIAALGDVSEVVVVDDGSRDSNGVRAAVDATPLDVLLLRNTRSRGPGAARQRGWQASEKRFVAFVDADVQPDRAWLASLLRHFDDPTVGAVAPRIRPGQGSTRVHLDAYEATRSPLDLGPEAALVRPGGRVSHVPTALLLARRTALESVGGFDARLQVGEDVDLVWRLSRAGWRVRYDPSVEARHPNRSSLAAWVRQRVAYGASAAALAALHGDAVAPLRMSGRNALAWSATLLGHPMAAMAIGGATTVELVPKLRRLDRPLREAVQIVCEGNVRAAQRVAEALRRPWWPLALALGLGCRRARPALAAALVIPPLAEWRAAGSALAPFRYLAFRLADDIAYGTGVWLGCARQRSVVALLPSFTSDRSASGLSKQDPIATRCARSDRGQAR